MKRFPEITNSVLLVVEHASGPPTKSDPSDARCGRQAAIPARPRACAGGDSPANSDIRIRRLDGEGQFSAPKLPSLRVVPGLLRASDAQVRVDQSLPSLPEQVGPDVSRIVVVALTGQHAPPREHDGMGPFAKTRNSLLCQPLMGDILDETPVPYLCS